ncbi:MAG: RNA polymerase sigma factor [Lachnospiraceae bacterium]
MQEQLLQFILDNEHSFYRYAFSYVHNRETAMDMVQNSFLKALENISSLRSPDAMKTWFYRILTNECLQTLRKSQKEALVEPSEIREEIYLEKAYEPDLELYEAVRRLPPDTQTIIMLHYYEEMTLREIADIIDCNINTVKSRLYAGLKKLKTIIGEDILCEI